VGLPPMVPLIPEMEITKLMLIGLKRLEIPDS
jgi:hypothetical protein